MNEDKSAHCFSCETHFPNYIDACDGKIMDTNPKPKVSNTFLNTYSGSFGPLTDRCISEETAKKYGVRRVVSSDNKVAQHIYPFFNGNEVVGTKTRYVDNKNFSFAGTYEGTGLFGEQLFRNTGGKYLTIVEGECDAMAAYELMQSKWACVSLKRGASGAVKDIRESIEFVESFENVVLCFDNDKAGIEAARKVARILKPGKAKIVTLPTGCKDANDMLRQKKFQAFMSAWWEARTYTPSGIMDLSAQKSEWLHRETKESIAYPWEGLNKKLYGMRKGELITLTGGTGLGKSSVTRELEHWLIKNTEDNVGIVALEENWLRTADGIISIEANDRVYLNERREQYTEEQLTNLFDKVITKGRVFIHAHLGATDIDEIFSKLRYIIVGCECKWVIVDHLHMLVNVLAEGDERRGIDSLMNKLRSLVEETGVGMILVSHLRRAAGDKGHEQGIEVSLSHLKGSQGIAQLSDCVIALERNQQAENEDEANTTKVRVLKSRYTGDTGLACSLRYNNETGRLFEVTEEETFDNTEF
tara:strand:- start:1752 stop:3341 length:1590 start_codon:yes stop_codon:yes gene_type:complete